MATTDYDKLEPGRATDEIVYSFVGGPKEFVCPKCGGTYFGTSNPTAADENREIRCDDEYNNGCRWRGRWADIRPPAYSTDPAAAMGLLEEMEKTCAVALHSNHPGWACEAMEHGTCRPIAFGQGDTIPLAIVRAFLKWHALSRPSAPAAEAQARGEDGETKKP